MKAIKIILPLFFAHACFAGDFDNPYMDIYRGLAKKEQVNLISNPYFEYYNNLTDLTQKYEQARAREQSTANKLLTAVTMGATSIGAMQFASGLAERQSDESAERDMMAYLATFTCDYGAGRNIHGGETNIELPVASDLLQMITEYKQLAAGIKERKEALNLLPGIESDLVLDAADSNLYNNASVGKTIGAFTSLSRALSDPDSEDAKKWQKQKDATDKKIKNGAIVAGVGAAGGAVGTLIINKGDKDEDKK